MSIIVIATGYVSELNLETTYAANKVKKVLNLEEPKVEPAKPVVHTLDTKPELEIKLITREVEKPVDTKVEITTNAQYEVATDNVASSEEKVVYALDDEFSSVQPAAEFDNEITATATAVETQVVEKTTTEGYGQPEQKPEVEHHTQRASERIDRLRDLSMKLKNKSVNELINEPAYVRKGQVLNSIPHSSETHVSKYTLSTDSDGRAELKENNSFLHEKPD